MAAGKRVDRASRIVPAAPSAVYAALVDPQALARWLPPQGMSARIEAFDARPGGTYRMVLTYDDGGSEMAGKSLADSDVVEGRFVELVPGSRMVQTGEFHSDDPAFAGTMRMTWTLRPVEGGTEVSIACEDVPSGIRPEDHDEGLNSSLDNLAAYLAAAGG